jgi:hypothetical protein
MPSEENRPVSRTPWWNPALRAAATAAPVIVFTAIFILFSQYRISPNAAVEASVANPLGLVTSNFVYDGAINIENITASSAFLLVVCLYYPKDLRIFMAYVLPFSAVAGGGLAELTAISSPYLGPNLCAQSCSFYGMSAIASAMIGFTFAAFFISFGLIIVQQAKGKISIGQNTIPFPRTSLRSGAVLASAFAVYVILLLVFSGLIVFPTSPTGNPGGNSSAPPPPPAILTQSPPVALVHSASITYGFLLCLTTFVFVNRRYHILAAETGRG